MAFASLMPAAFLPGVTLGFLIESRRGLLIER
jgi:hypothetical protein